MARPSRSPIETRPCGNCGKPVTKRVWEFQSAKTNYCSKACQAAGNRGEKNASWSGGRHQDQHGYIKVLLPDHPRADGCGYVFEHIVIAETALGKFIPEQHPIHHVNERPPDNAKTNLVICEDKIYHKLLHSRTRILAAGGDPNIQKICCRCKALVDLTNFHSNRSQPDGLNMHCKPCARRIAIDNYQRHQFCN